MSLHAEILFGLFQIHCWIRELRCKTEYKEAAAGVKACLGGSERHEPLYDWSVAE